MLFFGKAAFLRGGEDVIRCVVCIRVLIASFCSHRDQLFADDFHAARSRSRVRGVAMIASLITTFDIAGEGRGVGALGQTCHAALVLCRCQGLQTTAMPVLQLDSGGCCHPVLRRLLLGQVKLVLRCGRRGAKPRDLIRSVRRVSICDCVDHFLKVQLSLHKRTKESPFRMEIK